jgi:hypothetical protein
MSAKGIYLDEVITAGGFQELPLSLLWFVIVPRNPSIHELHHDQYEVH